MNFTERTRATVILATPSQDAQGRWDELLSPTQVLTGQLNLNNNMRQQEQQHQKKKKCHGNRKEQHKRRRIRRRQQQQMNKNTNHMDRDILINELENGGSQPVQIQV
jgi:hypothetical protein